MQFGLLIAPASRQNFPRTKTVVWSIFEYLLISLMTSSKNRSIYTHKFGIFAFAWLSTLQKYIVVWALLLALRQDLKVTMSTSKILLEIQDMEVIIGGWKYMTALKFLTVTSVRNKGGSGGVRPPKV